MNILHVGSCEVGEIRNSTDAVGYSCSRTASTQCFDRGSELCESHGDLWRMPLGFLPALLSVASSAALEACSRGTSRAKESLKKARRHAIHWLRAVFSLIAASGPICATAE